tara:strand:+ start:124 stop:561 length:438 start_codon:yes stop_codon:yes gene_type:complete
VSSSFISWCLLIGFVVPAFITKVLFAEIEEDNTFLKPVLNRKPKLRSWAYLLVFLIQLIGIFCSLLLVMHGVHIWNTYTIPSGNELPFPLFGDGGPPRRLPVLIIGIVHIWPAFLVFCYGLFLLCGLLDFIFRFKNFLKGRKSNY